jgi:GT2 family glycosyltransferase
MLRSGSTATGIGVVAIGRNEGERLAKCLQSATDRADLIVYVDSGSTDRSVQMAGDFGASVVALDVSVPFTAARARNEGFRRLSELVPDLRYVQFVDGDCTIVNGWMERAARLLDNRPDIAAVCGRRRERYPERSVYNMLCDIEWDTPVGEAKSCGGDVMIRVDAFRTVDGFCADLIAGEEPELCVRLRAAGWRIWRLGEEMTLHDAAIKDFGQWWKRTFRGGYAFAEGAALHGAPPERHWVRESRSAWVWGLAIPLATLGAVCATGAWAAAILLVYPLQVLRLFIRERRSTRESLWRAVFLVLGKFPEMLGQAKFVLNRAVGTHSRLIEYK